MGPPTSFPRSSPTSSQPPSPQLSSQQPPTFPPRLPPPNSNTPPPQFLHPGPGTTTSPSQVSTNVLKANILPPALSFSSVSSQFQAPTPAGPPTPVTVSGGMQMTPQHHFPPPANVLPVTTPPSSNLPLSQQPQPSNEQSPRGNLQMLPPARFTPPGNQPPNVSSSHPVNQTSTSHTAKTSANDTPPLLPSPQKVHCNTV